MSERLDVAAMLTYFETRYAVGAEDMVNDVPAAVTAERVSRAALVALHVTDNAPPPYVGVGTKLLQRPLEVVAGGVCGFLSAIRYNRAAAAVAHLVILLVLAGSVYLLLRHPTASSGTRLWLFVAAAGAFLCEGLAIWAKKDGRSTGRGLLFVGAACMAWAWWGTAAVPCWPGRPCPTSMPAALFEVGLGAAILGAALWCARRLSAVLAPLLLAVALGVGAVWGLHQWLGWTTEIGYLVGLVVAVEVWTGSFLNTRSAPAGIVSAELASPGHLQAIAQEWRDAGVLRWAVANLVADFGFIVAYTAVLCTAGSNVPIPAAEADWPAWLATAMPLAVAGLAIAGAILDAMENTTLLRVLLGRAPSARVATSRRMAQAKFWVLGGAVVLLLSLPAWKAANNRFYPPPPRHAGPRSARGPARPMAARASQQGGAPRGGTLSAPPSGPGLAPPRGAGAGSRGTGRPRLGGPGTQGHQRPAAAAPGARATGPAATLGTR